MAPPLLHVQNTLRHVYLSYFFTFILHAELFLLTGMELHLRPNSGTAFSVEVSRHSLESSQTQVFVWFFTFGLCLDFKTKVEYGFL